MKKLLIVFIYIHIFFSMQAMQEKTLHPSNQKITIEQESEISHGMILHKLVAYQGENAVGELTYSNLEKDEKCKLNYLMVESHKRNQKIGSALMYHLIEHAKQHKSSGIMVVSSENAKEFYKKLGFKEAQDSDDNKLAYYLDLQNKS